MKPTPWDSSKLYTHDLNTNDTNTFTNKTISFVSICEKICDIRVYFYGKEEGDSISIKYSNKNPEHFITELHLKY